MPFLDWVNKNQAVSSASTVPYHLLQLEQIHGDAQSAQDNLIIQGDNLQALKALLPFYTGKVKCIYIDPPFNTGSAFTHYDDKLEHSQWLSLIYPRLVLYRELLKIDGSIMIHLDDNETDYLKVLLDEVFGRDNFVNKITIDARSPSAFSTVNPGVFKASEYILWYAKKKNQFKYRHLRIPTDRDSAYNKFITNKSEFYEGWVIKPLKLAFLEHINNDRLIPLEEFIFAVIENLKSKSRKEVENFLIQNFKFSVMLNTRNASSQIQAKLNSLDGDAFKTWAYEYLIERVSVRYSEGDLDNFVFDNADRVFRPTEISDSGAGQDTVELKKQSEEIPNKIFCQKRENHDDIYILNGQQLSFYDKNVKKISGKLCATRLLTNIWTDISWEGISKEGGVKFNKGKKPEKLIERCIELGSDSTDIILDSFLGSGTTAAVAHKMGRRYIGIEMGEHAVTHCIPRLQKVIAGEQGGISKALNWQGGGGFSFYTLGEAVFDASGHISANVRFGALAAYIWLLETKTAIDTKALDKASPFIGEHEGVAYYLLYNGILGDRRPNGGNVLTNPVLAYLDSVHPHQGKKVIFGEASRIGEAKLNALGISFKQIPYELHERV